MKQCHSLNTAARRLHIPIGTLHRWIVAARTGKHWALLPGVSPSRPRVIARLAVTKAEVRALAKLARRHGYAPAYRTYEGRAALVEYLRSTVFPSAHFHQTIREAVAKLRKARPDA